MGFLNLPSVMGMDPKIAAALVKLVAKREVYDLGSGDGKRSRAALLLGAARVVAVDKDDVVRRATLLPGISRVQSTFAALVRKDPKIDVALVSWPWVHDHSLLRLLERAKTVLYLGKNTDGVRCGSPQRTIQKALFSHLCAREVFDYVPTQIESLLAYGDLVGPRALLPEEKAALSEDPIPYTEG
jgi:hypothetical protein